MLYATNLAFAFSYNVGDAHVFYLPSHLIVALLAAPAMTGAVSLFRNGGRENRDVVLACSPPRCSWPTQAGARIATSRRSIAAPTIGRPRVLAALTAGLDDRRAILLTDLNWQMQNGLSYVAKARQPELAVARMPDVAALRAGARRGQPRHRPRGGR